MLYVFSANYSFDKGAAHIEAQNLIVNHKKLQRKIFCWKS